MREVLTTDELKQGLRDSLETPIDLLNTQMRRLSLKDKPFQTFQPAEEGHINELWQRCLQIEQQLQVLVLANSPTIF
jgi:hypothetical protein